MLNWNQYLSLLNWQNQCITLDDFERLELHQSKIKSPRDLRQVIQNPSVKQYMIDQATWWKQAEGDYRLCQKNNIQLADPTQTHFPQILKYYRNSPTLLSYQGTPCWNHLFPLCIVGSRKSCVSVKSWMDHSLGMFVQKKPICIFSGGARGIDQKAHSIAIRVGIPTLCFLPSGILNFYPSSLTKWRSAILKTKGAFISSFHPLEQVKTYYFHHRNSLMVRMSKIVFMMQAEEKSGSMLTAKLANHYGVTLCTLPGPVMNPLFKGNLNLINDGTLMIRDEKDLETLYHVQQCHFQEASP